MVATNQRWDRALLRRPFAADDEVHRVMMDKVFPRQATVLTSDQLLAAGK
jgi:hypothetical protein